MSNSQYLPAGRRRVSDAKLERRQNRRDHRDPRAIESGREMQHLTSGIRDKPYASSTEHLLAELGRIELLTRSYVSIARQKRQHDDPYQGLYISEPEMDMLLTEPVGLPSWAGALPHEARQSLGCVAQVISDRVAVTYICGERLRLCELQRRFGLEQRDLDILLVAAAPELSLKFGRFYSYLQDDVTKRRPSIDLVLNLLSTSFADKLAGRARLEPSAPLLQYGILEVFEEPANPKPPSLARYLRLDPRILAFLLGSDVVDPQIASYAGCVASIGGDVPNTMTTGLSEFIERAVRLYQISGRLLLHLHGPKGVGKRTWAGALCARLRIRLLVVDGGALIAASASKFEVLVRSIAREAVLLESAIYWSDFDPLLSDTRHRALFFDAVAQQGGILFLAGNRPLNAVGSPDLAGLLSIEIGMPTRNERIRLWKESLGDDLPPELDAELPAVAAKFRFTAGDIAAAAASTRVRACWRHPEEPLATPAELYASCRERSASALNELARKVRPRQQWNDLVLPDDTIRQLLEICNRVRYSANVLEDWGFGQKLSLGKGLSALFSGPTGTGKTMAAEIIAAELGLDLYKIDLSIVVSKYIGETEKNLSRVFSEAEASNAILFFDEADALFGKRSEVKEAHDRYANVESSYLLQRMEEYEGISILATNLRRNMDEAFTRRLSFMVHFPVPECEERLRIWHRTFPPPTPLADDVDLVYMATQFKLSGGDIKNIALAAAFFAASEGTRVSMLHLVRATRRELQKLGKNFASGEFGKYAELLDEHRKY
jgi:SpoVK/Ycf46/Vps4 family AAA+-type ATPase